MYGLSLCSGIGGIDLGLHLAIPGYRTICYVEKEAYCQDILLARMADGVLDRAPIWGDIARFDVRPWCGLVDVVHGGYPCQPFSVAGKRAGADDERHLWPHVARIVAECQPTYGFFENVGGHLSLGFREVARDLEGMGYRVSAGLFTAAEVGAPHRRQRLYILAHRHGRGFVGQDREPGQTTRKQHTRINATSSGESTVGHPDDPRLEGRREPEREGPDEWAAWPPGPEERDRWDSILAVRPELAPAIVADSPRVQRGGGGVHAGSDCQGERSVPESRDGGAEAGALADATDGHARSAGGGRDARRTAEGDASQSVVRGVAHGLPHRVDRLKALGNAVVPDVAALAWRTLHSELMIQ